MAGTELDQEFLTMFNCMGTTDKDVLINDLHALLGSQLSRDGCAFFLDMTNWNLQAAVGAYYDFYNTTSLPRMTLVRDVTIGNGEAISPNTEFIKTWRIKNSGLEAWPSGVHLNLRGGDRMDGPVYVSLPALSPGEETDVSIRLRSPSCPGVYQSHWRMCTPNASECGEIIWVIICVEEGGVMGLTQQLSSITTHDEGQLDAERTMPHDQNPFGSPQSTALVSSTTSPNPVLHTSEMRYQGEQSPRSIPLVNPSLGTMLLETDTRDSDKQVLGDITSIARTSNVVTLVSRDSPSDGNQAARDDMQS